MKRIAAATALLLACMATDGSRRSSAQHTAPMDFAFGHTLSRARTVHEHLKARRFRQAVAECLLGYEESMRERRPRAALYYLNSLAGSYFALGEYRKAQERFIEARDLGLASGIPRWSAVALANLSSLYLSAFDTDSALAAAREAGDLASVADPRAKPGILLQMGRMLLHRGTESEAHALFSEAIRLASDNGDLRTRADAWDQLGLATLESGLLDQARPALRRAFALRRMSGSPDLFATQLKLAMLELRSGHTHAARQYIDAAFAAPNRTTRQVPPHLMHLTRAQVLYAQGDWPAALEHYSLAVNAAEEWRGRSLLADSYRVSADISLTQIYEGAVQTAAQLFQRTRNPRFAELAWVYSERGRQASLREGLAAGPGWTQYLPAEYRRKMERLRALEADYLSRPRNTTVSGDEATQIRMHLAEMESAARSAASESGDRPKRTFKDFPLSGENTPTPISLRVFKNTLGNSRSFISFVLGEQVSYRWVIGRKGLQMKLLAGKRQIAKEVEALRAAIQHSDPAGRNLSRRLFAQLFGGIPFEAGTHWHIAMDDRLFDLPVAALVTDETDGGPVYLVERQSFDFIPGAWALGAAENSARPQRFVGIGDGIYNTADPRYRANAGERRSWFRLIPSLVAGSSPPLQLPRLNGSDAEIEAAARESAAATVILTGARVNRREIVKVLKETPQFIHIAAHFLVERDGAGIAAVVLGVAPDSSGRPELKLLTTKDVANLRVPGSVVVMSGCSSGAGRIVPTAGVLGLARSWLAAGASAVIATHWPTLDDTGEIFSRFYAHMAQSQSRNRAKPAEALRRAQIDMLRSGTWRSEPKHWAAYQLIQRSN